MDKKIDIKEYEENTKGVLTFSLHNVNEVWKRQDVISYFSNMIYFIINEIATSYPSILVLRGVIISSNTIETYNEFFKDIPEFQKMMNPLDGNLIAGKAVTWGTVDINNIEKYHGVIILDENICAGIMDEKSSCYGIVAHELTHIAERFKADYYLGASESNNIELYNWEKLKFEYGRILLSEYIAQKISSPYYANDYDCLKDNLFSSIPYLIETTKLIDGFINQYRENHDTDSLWGNATTLFQRALNLIAASIGLIDGLDKKMQEDLWIKFSRFNNAQWEEVLNEIRFGLQNIDDNYDKNSFDSLGKAIEHSFNHLGIYPICEDNGNLRIRVEY